MKVRNHAEPSNNRNQSVTVSQSGNNNNTVINYQVGVADEEEFQAMRRLLEAQSELIRIYQNRRTAA